MDMQSTFIKELVKALGVAATEAKLPLLQTRIQIKVDKDGDPAKYFILDGGKEVMEITLRKLLGIGLVDIVQKEPQVSSFLNIVLAMLCFKNEVAPGEGNIRIFSQNQDGSNPLIVFLNKDAIVTRPTFSELADLYQEYVEKYHEQADGPQAPE